MTRIADSRTRKLLNYLFVAALAFNLFWLAGSLQWGLFDENSFLPSNSLRALAYPYYGRSIRESRFVGIALHELYDAPTLITSRELLANLFEVEEIRFHAREVTIQLVADPGEYVSVPPDGAIESYMIGFGEKEVGFVLPDENSRGSRTVVAIQDGDRVLFVPLATEEE
jgi:hypothetical protein